MHLGRFTHKGRESIGLISEGMITDIGDRFRALHEVIDKTGPGWHDLALLEAVGPAVPLNDVILKPALDPDRTIFALAANYRKHAEEAGVGVPDHPVVFTKPESACVGSGETIVLPKISTKMDYEGELAAVVGRTARSVSAADAAEYIAGYTIVNDLTARDLQWTNLGQHRIVDWLSSKMLDRTTPVGPWVVSAEHVTDPHRLQLRTRLNGQLMQDSSTEFMVFSIWEIVEYLSARVTLRSGDIIATGTPFGVGGFREIFLKAGDTVEVEIEQIGTLHNRVEAP